MSSLTDFHFEVPEHLVATRPLPQRRDSRLLMLQSHMNRPEHHQFSDFINYLNPGDVLVLNNTHVFPARLKGHKISTGGKVEILLSRIQPDGTWLALISCKGRLLPGTEILLEDSFQATVISRFNDEPGAYQIAFNHDIATYSRGKIPLPPYMNREADDDDIERYQTVFADPQHSQAVAAPTAGLHFDDDMIEQIKHKGVQIAYVTLHVGPGTFLPIRTDNIDEHQMHAEPWTISDEAAQIINHAKGRIIAVGTTSLRTLESAAIDNKTVKSGNGLTRLFIKPGFQFRIADMLLTNFHLPKTTLMLLVAAAVGKDRLLNAYQEAIEQQYRFFSYGDACLFDINHEI